MARFTDLVAEYIPSFSRQWDVVAEKAGGVPDGTVGVYNGLTGAERQVAFTRTPARNVRKRQVGPEVGPTSAFYSCILTGMHGPTCIFWAPLGPT
jgi:hypothetical protein